MQQEKIGLLIATKRKEKGLTQEQLAEQVGVTNKAVSKWETGKSMPDVSIIQELCKILGITVTTLLNGEESKEEDLIFKLLWMIKKIKQLYYAIGGLVICNIPSALERIIFIEEAMQEGNFVSGLLNGSFAGIKIIGVCVFAYGIASYGNATQQVAKAEKN